MNLKFKLQTSGFIEWHNCHPHGASQDLHCVSWVLKVSYDENVGLAFERGYVDRWEGDHVKLGELDDIECQRRMEFKLSPGDSRLVSLVQWLKHSGVFGWELCADIKPKADEWHVWRFIFEIGEDRVEWSMGVSGAPLPSFDAFKGFKFQDEKDFDSNEPGIFQHLKNPPENVDVLGPSAWGQYSGFIADSYWFFPAQSHFHFCHGDPRMVELTRRVFDLLESRSLPQVINYRDTDGRTLSVDFTRRSVRVANEIQSREVNISEATLNAFWKSLDGRNPGQPATSSQHWPNWPTHAPVADRVPEHAQDGTTQGFLWYAELCDGRDRWVGMGYATHYWGDQKWVEKFRYFDHLLSIDGYSRAPR